jgi:hypothetical protein
MRRSTVQIPPSGRLVWVIAALLLASLDVRAQTVHRYTIAIDQSLMVLDVRACFSGTPPPLLVAESLDAPLALIEARNEATGKPLVPSGALSLKNVPANGCIAYRVDVSQPIRRHDRTADKVVRVGRDLLAAAGLWLWRPEQLRAGEEVELAFILPPEISVSAPWQPVSESPPVFRLGSTPHDWPATVAFGYFRPHRIEVSGTTLDMAVLEGAPAVDVDGMYAWVVEAAQSVSSLYGRFPVPRVQILVVPNARGAEPAPWAYVQRGGGPAVHFFVNQRRPMEEFHEDWTATHELAHLLLPFVRHEDAWLSEGLATYYQNVLRARAGRMSAEQGWTRMHAGFLRGKENARGMTLAQATEQMYRTNTYMRVYWEGAAMMLLADVALRQASAGRLSLDSALAGLAQCCLQSARAWSAEELFVRFDELTGTTVFSELLKTHLTSSEFPDLAAVYRALGLQVSGAQLELLDGEEQRALRDAIMGPGNQIVFDSGES